MKITIYTIKDCAFSKQEKEYLTANKLMFEEKDLETNKDFLTEMLAISNNFAGTPVTRIEKDDGTIAVLKGFTKEEFDATFGLAPMPAAPVAEAGTPAEPVTPTGAPVTAPVDVPSVVQAPAEAPSLEVHSTTTVPNETPLETPIGDQDLSKEVAGPLQSVMDSLKAKAESASPTQPTEPPASVPPPVVDQGAPAIPDFPAK